MILNKVALRNTSKALLQKNLRTFAQLQNWETQQPPAVGSVSDYHLDTKLANSKYYNPHTFDPTNLDY